MVSRLSSILSAMLLCGCGAAYASNIAYMRTSWNGAAVHVVYVNLNSPNIKVTPALAKDGIGSSESFTSMVNRLQPKAAITGTFFCTRNLMPTGDIVIDGMRIHKGMVGAGVCVTSDNRIEFVPFKKGYRNEWKGYESVLCAGPTLVQNGKMFLIPRDEGFNDPSLFVDRKRTALGVTAHNKLIMVAVDTPIRMRAMAKIMVHLGAVNAILLDGGASTGLYHKGRHITRPNRNLTNLLVVYGTQDEYDKRRIALAPQLRDRKRVIAAANPPAEIEKPRAKEETIVSADYSILTQKQFDLLFKTNQAMSGYLQAHTDNESDHKTRYPFQPAMNTSAVTPFTLKMRPRLPY